MGSQRAVVGMGVALGAYELKHTCMDAYGHGYMRLASSGTLIYMHVCNGRSGMGPS